MIERDRADCVKTSKVVFVRRIIAVPSDYIQRRMVYFARPQIAAEFCDLFKFAFAVLIPRDRRFEIAGIGKTICTDRPKIRKAKLTAVILADITPTSGLARLQRGTWYRAGSRRPRPALPESPQAR